MKARSLILSMGWTLFCLTGCGESPAENETADGAKTESPIAAKTESPVAAKTESSAAAKTQAPVASKTEFPVAAKKTPDISSTIEQLFEDLKAGEFEKKYVGKQVEIKGTITAFTPEYTFLGDTEPAKVFLWDEFPDQRIGVKCGMKDSEPWQTMRPGQTVRIQGTGKSGDEEFELGKTYAYLFLEDAELVEAEPLQTPINTIDAETLANEFVADMNACRAKYEKKPLLITGKIAKIQEPAKRFDSPSVVLAAPNEVGIHCQMGPGSNSPLWMRLQQKSPGDETKFLAMSVGFEPENKKIILKQSFELH